MRSPIGASICRRCATWCIARPRRASASAGTRCGCWHALWLLARGWTVADVAAALERDPHTIGEWRGRFCRDGPAGIAFEQTDGSPPALGAAQQAELKAAVLAPPRAAGIEAGDWSWKVVRT